MAYGHEEWERRYVGRTDLSTKVIHLTKPQENDGKDSFDVLFDILESGIIKGSTTKPGFIIGRKPAACFQDAPVHSVAQNILYEIHQSERDNNYIKRYSNVGIAVPKDKVYQHGGRPVIYDKTCEAKKYLPPDQYWRIVNFDLGNQEKIVDWSHEREWRVPNEFYFNISDITIILWADRDVVKFINRCDDLNKNYYRKMNGITTFQSTIA